MKRPPRGSPSKDDLPFEEHADHAILRPAGYLNALAGDRIEKLCSKLFAKGIRYIIINFSQVAMVNTIGISILVGILERAIAQNGLVYFTELGKTDRQVFEVLNLHTVAPVFPTDDQARRHLRRDQEAVRRARPA